MNRKLIEKYVATKMAKRSGYFAHAKETLSEEHYRELVMSSKLSEMPRDLALELEERLRQRLGLKKHKSIFYKPTICQWLTDLMGSYRPEDILSALHQVTNCKPSELIRSTISGTIINRPFLIDLVEMFEEATGKLLLKDDSLDYLGDSFTYRDMADFFTCETGIA